MMSVKIVSCIKSCVTLPLSLTGRRVSFSRLTFSHSSLSSHHLSLLFFSSYLLVTYSPYSSHHAPSFFLFPHHLLHHHHIPAPLSCWRSFLPVAAVFPSSNNLRKRAPGLEILHRLFSIQFLTSCHKRLQKQQLRDLKYFCFLLFFCQSSSF